MVQRTGVHLLWEGSRYRRSLGIVNHTAAIKGMRIQHPPIIIANTWPEKHQTHRIPFCNDGRPAHDHPLLHQLQQMAQHQTSVGEVWVSCQDGCAEGSAEKLQTAKNERYSIVADVSEPLLWVLLLQGQSNVMWVEGGQTDVTLMQRRGRC